MTLRNLIGCLTSQPRPPQSFLQNKAALYIVLFVDYLSTLLGYEMFSYWPEEAKENRSSIKHGQINEFLSTRVFVSL